MNPLRSVGGRLSLALALVVAAALALVDLIVVPSLQHSLVHAKLAQLRDAAPGIAAQFTANFYDPDPVLQAASESADARVSIFQPLTTDPKSLTTYADSNFGAEDLSSDPLAQRAASLGKTVSGTTERHGRTYAEVAKLLPDGDVLLLSASLRDALANVSLVRRRLLFAGLIALAASLVVGYLAATVFARRLRRLERAADRIAGGDFSEPVVDAGGDEVGELAGAFERMRERLAGLERARREFIANASHELRTPLFSLGGFLELMENEDLDPETQHEFLRAMREQIDRLTKLATELLDLSRLDAGRMHLEAETVDLGALADSLAAEFRPVATRTGHRVQSAPEGAPLAVGDEERSRQIGRILVENALVHTRPGTNVWLSAAERDGAALLIVEDDGPGIPPADAPHVFERFYRVEGGVAAGSGLGLAIASELAGLMGGSLTLDTAADRTRFTLVLPVARREQEPPDEISRENVEAGAPA